MKLYMFQTVCLSNIKSLFTVHSAMVYVIQLLGRTIVVLLKSGLQTCTTDPGPAQKLSTNLYDIYYC